MLANPSLADRIESTSQLRHPIWMLLGAIVGLGASVASLVLASWLIPGIAAQMLFLPIFACALSAMMFRKGESLVPLVWPLVGFPLLVASALYLGGVIRALSPPGGSPIALYLTLAIALASLAYSQAAKKQPFDLARIRRSLVTTCLMVGGVIGVCVAFTIAAYVAPVPSLQAALPMVAATSFAAGLSMSLVALAWWATIRLWPTETTRSAAAHS